jgi:hypothetical protein
MDKFNGILQRKILGVKVLYLAAVFVVALVAVAWRMKSSTGGPDEPIGDTVDDTATDASTAYPDTDGTGTVTTVTTGNTTTVTQVDNNETWSRRAIEWLIAQGTSPDKATTSIQKYINAEQLSYDEGQLRDKAVAQFGLPPEIPISGGTLAKPATAAPVVKSYKPPAVHKVTGSSDNTYTELAKLYYGSSADKYVDLIQAHNSLKHSGEFKVGTNVFIPAKTEPRYYKAVAGKVTAEKIAAANGLSTRALRELNDAMKFPVKVGTQVRVA